MNGRIAKEEDKGYSNLPVIGRIKVGEIVENGAKSYPRSLDYFKATGKYASKFYEVFEDKPNKIEIIFVSDDIRSVCEEKYELRGSDGRLHGEGDGITFEIWDGEKYVSYPKEGNESRIKEASKNCGSRKGWEATLTLRFIIPKISGVMGVWQLVTKGAASSIPGIINAFDTVLHHAGTVQMIPFDLQVEMVKSQKPGKASRFPVIKLVPNIGTENLDTVRNYLQQGGNVLGIRKLVNSKESLQIEGEVDGHKQAEILYGDKEEFIGSNWEEEIEEDSPFNS